MQVCLWEGAEENGKNLITFSHALLTSAIEHKSILAASFNLCIYNNTLVDIDVATANNPTFQFSTCSD